MIWQREENKSELMDGIRLSYKVKLDIGNLSKRSMYLGRSWRGNANARANEPPVATTYR